MGETLDPPPGSVSRLLGGLREGDEEAVQQLWRRCFQPLVRLAQEDSAPMRVRLEGFGTHEGLHYLIMPLVSGGDLRERLAELTIGPESGLDALCRVGGLMEKVARAVAFLHRHGILHRDLKPSNILLSGPASWEPLVCDFGLALRQDGAPGPAAGSHAAPIAGTPVYMAPEQIEGGLLSGAADLWSLGAILYQLLTGWPPFVAPGGSLDTAAKLTAPGPPPPRALGLICGRCLARDPAQRYRTADELADDLLRSLEVQG